MKPVHDNHLQIWNVVPVTTRLRGRAETAAGDLTSASSRSLQLQAVRPTAISEAKYRECR
jgi:hypothetical protein